MLKKLLYLYNDGHNPFPHMGQGGLGYHLPNHKLVGKGIDEYYTEDGDFLFEEDDGTTGTERRRWYGDNDEYEVVGQVLYDDEGDIQKLYKKGYKFNPETEEFDYEYVSDDEYDADEIYKLEKQHKQERKIIDLEKDIEDTTYLLYEDINKIKDSKTKNEEKYYKKKVLDDLEGISKIQLNQLLKKGLTYNQIREQVKKKNIHINPEYKPPIDLMKIKQLYNELDESGKSLIDKVLSYKKINKQIEELEKIKNTNADQNMQNYAASKLELLYQEQEIYEKPPEFVLPTESELTIDQETINEIIDNDIIINEENKQYVPTELRNITKAINKISKTNPYDTFGTINPNIEYRDMMKDISIAGIQTELGVTVDDKFYEGEAGKDWEMQAEHNTELLKEIVKESLGDEYQFVSMQPQSNTKNDIIDIIMEVINEEGETEFIDLELKKYAHLPAYSKYSTIQSIYDNDSSMFNDWFYIFKDGLNKIQSACGDSGDYTDYNDLLSSISTNGKIDNKKVLDKYVESGCYFSLPLTVTKIKTPTIEQIKNSKYDNDAFIKYLYHKKRLNKSENKLLVGIAIEDAILFDNINNRFDPETKPAIQTLNIVYNAYGKKKQDAYGYPACYLSVLNPNESIQQGFLSRDAMKQKRISAIQKAKALKALKAQKENDDEEENDEIDV